MLNEASTNAIVEASGTLAEMREAIENIQEQIGVLHANNLPQEAHWTIKAWRCREKPMPSPGVGFYMETRIETCDTWERIPNLTWQLLEWQLHQEPGGDFMPDPGPIQIEYHPEGGESGIGTF
jgi:hypothetical protein